MNCYTFRLTNYMIVYVRYFQSCYKDLININKNKLAFALKRKKRLQENLCVS